MNGTQGGQIDIPFKCPFTDDLLPLDDVIHRWVSVSERSTKKGKLCKRKGNTRVMGIRRNKWERRISATMMHGLMYNLRRSEIRYYNPARSLARAASRKLAYDQVRSLAPTGLPSCLLNQ